VARTPNTGSKIDAAREAARLLDDGQVVVLRTETVYGVFARGDIPQAIERVRALPRRHDAGPWGALAWHAPASQHVLDALNKAHADPSPALERIINTLWPGPVTLRLRADNPEHIAAAAGLPPRIADDGLALAARVPDDTWAQLTLQAAQGPVVAASAEPIDTGLPTPPGTCPQGLEAQGVAAVFDDGPTRHARHSTVVEADTAGDWTIRSEGARTADQVREQLARLVLFVCTGNTCRSPMAEAIARAHLERAGLGHRVLVASAGVTASHGAPATPEATRAAEAVGASLTTHRSQPLTPELLDRADVVYTMTESHQRAAMAMAESTQNPKIHTLDPEGDIEDPIGGPQSLYDAVARRLVAAIERRHEEMAP